MKRPIVLVGLPGSGKTTVGRLVARDLGAEFVDVDAAIEARELRTIDQLFAEPGEAAFRNMERQLVAAALGAAPAVVAPGGGWAAQPGNLEQADDALVVYLEVSPEVAAQRLGQSSGRPLLAGDPRRRLGELLDSRRRFYDRADEAVATDGREPAAIAADVLRLARSRGGW